MAFGPLNLLGRVIGAAYPFIRLGVTLGRSIEAIGGIITRAFARADAAVVRRVAQAEVRQRAGAREALGRPLDEVLPDELIPEAITKQRRTYSWRTRFGFIDPNSGRHVTRYLNVSTDSQLTAEEALEEARQMLEDEYAIDPSFLTEEVVIGVTRAAPGRRL